MIRTSRIFAGSAVALALLGAGALAQGDRNAPITTPPAVVQQPGSSPNVAPGTVRQPFDAVQTPSGQSAALPPPQVHQDRGVRYVSGGVSDVERDQLAQIARGYSLQLEMAQVNPAGAPNPYVANVNIVVSDATGQPVLNARSDGPLFYAQLPPGRYRIAATTEDGRTVTRSVELTGRAPQKIGLRWSAEGPLG